MRLVGKAVGHSDLRERRGSNRQGSDGSLDPDTEAIARRAYSIGSGEAPAHGFGLQSVFRRPDADRKGRIAAQRRREQIRPVAFARDRCKRAERQVTAALQDRSRERIGIAAAIDARSNLKRRAKSTSSVRRSLNQSACASPAP